MELTIKEIGLISQCLQHDGTKELNPQTKLEVFASRRLNGEESAQRRHFSKAVQPILEKYNKDFEAIKKDHNDYIEKLTAETKKKNPKEEGQTKEEYNKKINIIMSGISGVKGRVEKVNKDIKALEEVKSKIEVTDKTMKVMKKYFKEYGDEAGFEAKDDAVVEEIEKVLK